MPSYVHEKYGLRLPVVEGMTDEQIGLQMDRLVKEYEARAKGASVARGQVRDQVGDPNAPLPALTAPPSGMEALEEFLGPPQAASAPQAVQVAPGQAISPRGIPTPSPSTERPSGARPGLIPGRYSPHYSMPWEPGFSKQSPELRGRALEEEAAIYPSPGVEGLTGGYPGQYDNPFSRAVARHLPGALAGLAAGAALGPQAGLITRTGVQAGVTGLMEALAGGAAGEDPIEAGGKGLLYGMLGEAGGTAVRKGAAPFASKVTEVGRKMAKTIAPTIITPGRMTSSWLLDVGENIAGAGVFGGGRMQVAYEAMETAADAALTKFRQGIIVADDPAIRGLYKAAANAPSQAGGRLADELVDLRHVVQVARALVKKDKGRNPAIGQLADHIEDLVTRRTPSGPIQAGFTSPLAPTSPGKRTSYLARFEDVTGLLSHLKQFTRTKGIDPMKTDIALGAAKQMVKFTHRAAEQTARKAGPEAFAMWRLADSTTRIAHAGEWMEDLMQAARSGKTDLVSGATLYQRLIRMDPNKTKHVAPQLLSEFKEFAQILAASQQKNPEGIGRMMIQLKQAAALGTLGGTIGYAEGGPSGAAYGAAIGVLGMPLVLSRLLTNPVTARWLTTGLGSPSSRKGAEAIGRLAGFLSGKELGELQAEEAGQEELDLLLKP